MDGFGSAETPNNAAKAVSVYISPAVDKKNEAVGGTHHNNVDVSFILDILKGSGKTNTVTVQNGTETAPSETYKTEITVDNESKIEIYSPEPRKLEKNGKLIIVVSCKGGVGKSTVACNMAEALACSKSESRVLLCDCDSNQSSLDIMMGCQNELHYSVYDISDGAVELDQAVFDYNAYLRENGESIPESNSLQFLGSSPIKRSMGAVSWPRIIDRARECYDYIILDMAPGIPGEYQYLAANCDMAWIVTSQCSTSLRAAERTGLALLELGCGQDNMYLVMNMFEPRSVRLEIYPGIIEMIERIGIKLLGIIPFDKTLKIYQEAGKLPYMEYYSALREHKNLYIPPSASAVNRIAKRVLGENIPLPHKLDRITVSKIL